MKQQGNIVIILSLIAALVFGVILYNQSKLAPKTQQTVTNSVQTKTFHSKNLKFSVFIPSELQIEEKFTTILLKKNTQEIVVSRVATNFENIKDYLNDLSEKNKLEILEQKQVNINGLVSINGVIKPRSNPSQKELIYFIFVDNWVYSLSTSSESLYSDLDQIAKSFKYTPH